MVFVLDDIAKIETDRKTERIGIVEKYDYTQPTDSIITDTKTAHKIDEIMELYVAAAEYYVWGNDIGGVLEVFTDAFLNAGMWGNRDVPGKRIQVCIKYGLLGSVIYVEDEGSGFDYKTQIERLQRGQQHSFTRRGGGLRKFHASNLHVAYHGCGNKVSIATKVSSEEELRKFLSNERSR